MFATSPLPPVAPTFSDAIQPMSPTRSPLLAAISRIGRRLFATMTTPRSIVAAAPSAPRRQDDHERRAMRWDGSHFNEIRNRCGAWE